jgi:outer membrane protein OmpA-like peptidoglycan-associated protein
LKVPLELREAREAIAIAKAQGADQYAPDVMAKAAINLQNAEGYYHSHNEKELNTVAREATQQSEDARRISIVKEREAADLAAKQAAAHREQLAKDQAAAADAEAARQASLRAAAETERAQAEREKREAEIATAEAVNAKNQADAARAAAIAEQQRLANETAAAKAARENAERDSQALRQRLRDQLNAILQTRDTARGLIVSLSDVLFDFNQATLKPGAKEKLAKVSGILLAYPTLMLNVEGYTDNVGSDDYNQKLSERRADAVRDYLTANGISPANIQAVGFGKASPVASNDSAAGRQQNRRVEMVVSGDVIGQPNTPTTSSLR